MDFKEWLKSKGFEKQANQRYTIERCYLFEIYENQCLKK